jgi:hypothetical protein
MTVLHDGDLKESAMSNPAAIRDLFLHPRPSYPLPDVATLLGVSRRELRAWLESGELEGVGRDRAVVVPWAELVSFGMEFWSQEVVEEALGADVAAAIPELLRLTDLEVRIPRMEVVTLERLAALDGETVSAVLSRELLGLMSEHSPWLSLEVPGFAEALAWPEWPAMPLPVSGGGGTGAASGASLRAGRERRARKATEVGCVCASAMREVVDGPSAAIH